MAEIIKTVVEGVKTFVIKLGDKIKNIAKHYSKNKISNEWEETVVKKDVDERDVPEELLAKVKATQGNEVDTTDMLAIQLSH